MKKFEEIFHNKNFEKKINNLKNNISNYLTKTKYDIRNIEIEELYTYNDFDGFIKIYPSDKCPENIKIIVLDFIKTEFNDNNL